MPEASDAIARSGHERRWHEHGRTCVATNQDQHNNLTAVSVRLSRVACALAGLWDWEAANDAKADEQRRIAGQIRPFLEYPCKSWSETEWRQEAARFGNQIDVLVEWVRKTLAARGCPVEVIGKWGGSEECAARLLEQRSAGKLRFRSPLFKEEQDGLEMARFLAKSTMEPSNGH